MSLKAGQVGKVCVNSITTGQFLVGWFLAIKDNEGVCVLDDPYETGEWSRTPSSRSYWNLAGIMPVPPEEWSDEVCVAVAKEMLLAS